VKLDRLERVIREALRSSIHYEKLAGKFKLMLYRRDASNLSKEIGAKVVLRQKRAASRRTPAQMVRLGGLTGMTKPESNVIPWALEPPAEVTPDQVSSAIAALVRAYTADATERHIVPLDGLSEEYRDVLLSHAFYAGQAGIDDVEHKLRVAMKAADVDEKEIKDIKLAVFMRWAKDLTKKLVAQEKRRAQRARANVGKTDAGRPDEELNAVAGMSSEAQIDALSGSMPLVASAWLRHNRSGRLWFDEFEKNYFSDWDGGRDDKVIEPFAVNDSWMRNVYFAMLRGDTRLARLSETHAHNAIHHFAFQDVRNAPREWMHSLKWDGVMRLPTWLSTVYGTPQDAYHEAIGRNWFVGMAARINRAGSKMDNMPVLIGKEGLYKSTSLEIIGGKLSSTQTARHYYGNLAISAEKLTDFLATLNGLIVGEVAELDSLMNKKVEQGRVKNLLSTPEDKYRAPYGRKPEPHRRTCVICATTNEWHFNNFEGEARRFWPFEVTRHADLEWLLANRDQLFAEAHERHKRGEDWHQIPRDQHQVMIKEHRIDDPMVERIQAWLQRQDIYTGTHQGKVKAIAGDPTAIESTAHWGTLVTTSRLMTEVLQQPLDKQGVTGARKIATTMRHLGWKQVGVRTGKGEDAPWSRVWVTDAPKQGQLFDKTEE
jgi:predicted P-loop ATPase